MFHATLLMISTCFMHTLCHIYAFSGTNLLTRCRSASSCFLMFLVSEILVRKYSRNWTKSTPRDLFSHEASRRPKMIRSGATSWRHNRAVRPGPWPRRPVVWPPDLFPPPTYSLRRETPVPRATIRKTFQRRRRRRSHLGGSRRSPPTPCRRGESSPGGLYAAMVASGVMCE